MKDDIVKNERNRDIFYGVVAIATLIIALIGATLAYFTLTVRSNEGAINAKSSVVSISYQDGQDVIAQADELIPSDFNVVKSAYEEHQSEIDSPGAGSANICLDSNNKQVCSIYRFTIGTTSEQGITAMLNTEKNTFATNLKYALYDVTNGSWKQLDGTNESTGLKYCDNDDEDSSKYCFNGLGNDKTYMDNAKNSLFGYDNASQPQTETISEDKTYDLVIFLNEAGIPQDEEQGKEYQGTIIVNLVNADGYDDGHITGKWNSNPSNP